MNAAAFTSLVVWINTLFWSVTLLAAILLGKRSQHTIFSIFLATVLAYLGWVAIIMNLLK